MSFELIEVPDFLYKVITYIFGEAASNKNNSPWCMIGQPPRPRGGGSSEPNEPPLDPPLFGEGV